VLTMFAASWCAPCKASKPHFFELANSNSDVVFCLIEAENKRLAALQTGLRGVPTFVGTVNGRELFRVAGGQTRGQLQDMIKKLKSAR